MKKHSNLFVMDEHGILRLREQDHQHEEVPMRWCHPHRNGIYDEEQSADQVIARCKRIIALLTQYQDADHLPMTANAWNLLQQLYPLCDDLQLHIPRIECWCVIKHYSAPNWKPTVWTGHNTKQQAVTFAKALTAHYAKKYPGSHQDKFLVERALARPTELISPAVTATAYAARLL